MEVSVSLYGPDGRLQRSGVCRQGTTRISEIAKQTGEHRVRLESCDHQSDSEYAIVLAPVRTAVETDRKRVAAERALEEADRLTRAKPSRPVAALRKQEEALTAWRTLGDRSEEINTLHSAGNLYRDSGNFVRATEYFDRALKLANPEKLSGAIADILRAIAIVHLRKEDSEQALQFATQALSMSRSNSDRNGEAEALLLLEDIHYRIGDFDKAADEVNAAYKIWEGLRYRRGQARSLWELAVIQADRNEFREAYDYAERARALFDALDDDMGRARSSALLGHILSSTGRKQEALDRLEEAKAVLVDSGDLTSEAMVMNSLAMVYADLGDYTSALPFAKRALEKYANLGDKSAESYGLSATAYYYFSLGDLANARSFLERALKGFQATSNSRREAFCWRDLGIVHQASGTTQLALEYLNRSLEMSRAVVDRRLEASVLVALGRVYENAGSNERALELFRESLRLHKATEDRFGEISSLYHLAGSFRRLGDIKQSVASSEAAIEIIENLRTSLASSGLRTFYFASAREHFDLYIDSLMQRQDGIGPDPARALEFSEKARARTLLDSISETRISISEGLDRELVEHGISLGAKIDAISERYTELLSSGPNSKALGDLSDELRRLNAEYGEIQGQLRTSSPQYAALVQPQPLKLKEIQERVLDDDSLLLEYALGDRNSYLWAVTREDFASFELPKRSEIEKKVRELRQAMTARIALPGEKVPAFQARVNAAEARYPEVAAELSRMLLEPVADRLGKRRLVIVPDGVLQYLPFGALPTPQSLRNSSFNPLIVDHEVVNLPSASTLAVIRREAPLRGTPDRTLAVFADPVFDASDPRVSKPPARSNPPRAATRSATASSLAQILRGSDPLGIRINLPPLPATRQEAEAILTMAPADQGMAALGFNATKAAAMNPDLKRYRIVHFATHTILNDDHPDLSSLVLSLVDEKGNPRNGHLRLRDMYNLQLAAELVVLSACDTGLGKEVKGEGLMSMVRGFMYSGTPRVLASLWKVNDEATAELMTEFYKHLLKEGLTPAAALRQAQITQMKKRSRQSPYYWAGFQLQGEWN